jgi:hypothetical protein
LIILRFRLWFRQVSVPVPSPVLVPNPNPESDPGHILQYEKIKSTVIQFCRFTVNSSIVSQEDFAF